jgi:hypothetical protein
VAAAAAAAAAAHPPPPRPSLCDGHFLQSNIYLISFRGSIHCIVCFFAASTFLHNLKAVDDLRTTNKWGTFALWLTQPFAEKCSLILLAKAVKVAQKEQTNTPYYLLYYLEESIKKVKNVGIFFIALVVPNADSSIACGYYNNNKYY